MRWLVAAIVLLTTAVPVLAEGIEFEDDFDSYGTGVECASTPDQGIFDAAWPATDECSSLVVEDSYYGTCPDDFKGSDLLFYVKHGKEILKRNVKDLMPIIQVRDPSMNAVNGSDTEPLTLSVHVSMQWVDDPPNDYEKACRTTFWIELFAANDPAPNNQKLIEVDCFVTNMTPSNPHRSIAFGGYPGSVPKSDECPLLLKHLYADVIYDGDHWTVLKDDVPVPGLALRPSQKGSWWTITIKSSTVDIEVNSFRNGVVTRTGIPRAYMGAFQTIGLGSCEESQYPAYIDEVSLYGGFLTTHGTGACCLVDGSCNDGVEAANCPGDAIWHEGQTCANVTCCPKPWADIDFDGDVDQTDFGMWQRCFTGEGGVVDTGCECYDRDDDTGAQGGDGDVDVDDFAWFNNCFTAPTVPLDTNDPPLDCIP